MYRQFSLTLTVTHACNLRCDYCYAGHDAEGRMPDHVGRKAIDRAVASLASGGTLEVGFFGGEPLLEARLIAELIAYARHQTQARQQQLRCHLTTNGTLTGPEAWSMMTSPEVDLAVSCDGLAEMHDRHRRTAGGQGTAECVHQTIRRLLAAARDLRVVMVVRPDTMHALADGIRLLTGWGVRHIEPTLDLWTSWSDDDVTRLQAVIGACARVWRDGLPAVSIGWFDEKAAQLANLPRTPSARCGFGDGELAVAPSGRLYPCERLIGADDKDSAMVLHGNVNDGDDFLDRQAPHGRSDESCDACAMLTMCNTICRCSNYVRSGDVRKPDWLLCAWNQACLTATAGVLKELTPAADAAATSVRGDRRCRTMP